MFYMKRHQRSWILQDAEIDSVAMTKHKLRQTKYNYICINCCNLLFAEYLADFKKTAVDHHKMGDNPSF